MTDQQLPPELNDYFSEDEIVHMKRLHSVELAASRHSDFLETVEGYQFSDDQIAELQGGVADPGEWAYQVAKKGTFKPEHLNAIANNNDPGGVASFDDDTPYSDTDVHAVKARQAAEGPSLEDIFGEEK